MTIVHLELPELSCEFFFSFFQALCFIFHVSWSLSENLFLYANYVNTKLAEVKIISLLGHFNLDQMS